MDVSNDDLTAKIVKHIKSKKDLSEAETHYLPPHIKDNSVQSAVLVSEGEVVEKTETSVLLELTAHSEEPVVHDSHAEVEVDDVGKSEQVLVEESSVDVVAEGEMQGGSADTGIEDSITIDTIVTDIPRVKNWHR